MLLEAHRNRTNKKAKRLNFHKGRQSRSPSQTNGDAKIQINVETAIQKLREIAQKYIGVSNPYGFLTDLRTALGIPNKQGASKYGEVTKPRNDGSVLQASLRITNHQANAGTYITHNANCEYNLSIVVRKTRRRNTFKPHDGVRLDEFVYYGKNIAQVENPLTQIVNSIIGFLQNGDYIDTTGVALPNTSPQTNNDNNNQENKNINCNRNMNKKLIRLTESDLHRIVKESVNRVLSEAQYTPKKLASVDYYGKELLEKYRVLRMRMKSYERDLRYELTPDEEAQVQSKLRELRQKMNDIYDECKKRNLVLDDDEDGVKDMMYNYRVRKGYIKDDY